MDNSELPPKSDQSLEARADVPIVDPDVRPPELTSAQPPVVGAPKKSRRGLWVVLSLVLVLLLAGGFILWRHADTAKSSQQAKVSPSNSNPQARTQPKLPGLALDVSKNYGNKYADGFLPVGDGKYVTTGAKQGYVYACSQYAHNLGQDQGGAGTRGPWFTSNNTQYDVNKKAHVLGSVTWQPSFSNTVSAGTRTIVTNNLPNHVTGVFPIQSSDPAYSYDRNPNPIKGQSLTYALSASPTYSSTPNCLGGQVGVMLTGVALFNAFDAGGRDAGAWEVQDNCGGHPEKEGEYHYHTLSGCIKDISVHTVVGYALDGYPITGPQVGTNNILTTSDLDECHGITSAYYVDGKSVTGYHYVMTQDFPYSASCFRSTAANPPGQPTGPQP